ncbi:hypothetical protein [Psychrobacter sp. K31L]|uniref:hypothetical protein n=1 Tax=Psychrobacter sp. K31L TaxID=2820758 RepID=UPI001B3447CC|nr:hypothetical protein [Psychrobacter sp. K31L]MBP3945637.1 hypothetical protein [Psychrobacter sp. K31L]
MQSKSINFSNEASKLLNEYESGCKNDYHNYLMKFSKLLAGYIAEAVFIKLGELRLECESEEEAYKFDEDVTELQVYLDIGEYTGVSVSLSERLAEINITVENIKLPYDNDIKFLNSESREILWRLGRIDLINCYFESEYFDINNNTYFKDCNFENNFTINPFSKNNSGDRYRYINCNFNGDVSVIPSGNNKEILCNLFYECNFSKKLTIQNLTFKRNLFIFPDPISLFKSLSTNADKSQFKNEFKKIKNHHGFEKIIISKCIFELEFKLNGFNYDYLNKLKGYSCEYESDDLEIKDLDIIDTKFESKFEIKNRNANIFNFKNSNVTGIFDAFESKFHRAYFFKSIFKDFAAFEKVNFSNGLEVNKTIFEYTTFKDFSNFRNTKFPSGLDFSTANLKQEPNFLNTDINLKGTDRETLRIVKNSFEKNNNKIEANRFFTYEMREYRKETKWIKNPFRRLVLDANYVISGFGNNYVWPIIILFASVALYVHLLIHQNEWVVKTLDLMSFIGGDRAIFWFDTVTYYANEGSKVIIPFNKLLEAKQGFEFISLLFFIWFGVLIWQTVVAVKRNTQH